jgi:hypothetical protein
MRKRRAETLDLTTFFLNCDDRGYKSAEAEFVDVNVTFPIHEREVEKSLAERRAILSDPNVPDLLKASPAHFLRMEIMKTRETKPDGTVRYNDSVWRIVRTAVNAYGMDAIRLDAVNKHQMMLKPKDIRRIEAHLHPLIKKRNKANRIELGYLDSVGVYVCAVIRQWQREALRGTPNDRRNAVKRLKTIFADLIPDLRGKRKGKLVGSKYDVMAFYYRELFRLFHVENALRSSDGPRNSSLRVKQASENYGLRIEIIREFWGLDENDQPDRQPFRLKDMARELTARQFNAKHQTISNFLSS